LPVQFGWQQNPWKQTDSSAQVPLQTPPQPSGAPPHLPAQTGRHLHDLVLLSQKICAPVQHWPPKQHSPSQLAQALHVLWLGSVQVSLNAQQTEPHACAVEQQVLVSALTQI
jgi:hypothetical protein